MAGDATVVWKRVLVEALPKIRELLPPEAGFWKSAMAMGF